MIKVLVVEDEKIIREGLIESISWDLLNCKIVGQGKNGKEGLELIKTLNPDLVITDIKMPILDGLEMIEHAMEEEFQFKAIILSSYSEFEYAKKGIQLGVLDYILKPLDEDILLETIEKFRNNFYKSESDSISRYLSEEYNIFVRKTVQIILDRYVTKLSIKEIALELDVSASYLSRKIKEETD
ncbi:MAG: response regulator transcription factor, partial [Cetobacterium sp.]